MLNSNTGNVEDCVLLVSYQDLPFVLLGFYIYFINVQTNTAVAKFVLNEALASASADLGKKVRNRLEQYHRENMALPPSARALNQPRPVWEYQVGSEPLGGDLVESYVEFNSPGLDSLDKQLAQARVMTDKGCFSLPVAVPVSAQLMRVF